MVVGFGILVGWGLSHPSRDRLETNPALWGMAYRTIHFMSAVDRVPLEGWWIPSPCARLTVIMAHGYGSNREEAGVPGMAVAHALHMMGANVLLFDFRGQGRSSGSLVSVGILEQRDLKGAISWARTLRPRDPVALLGYSMGASTALMVAATDHRVAAVIADSPFADLSQYLQNHLPIWTHLPRWPFNGVILGLLPLITGLHVHDASPIARIGHMGSRPVLLIAGSRDATISEQDSIRLYRRLCRVDPEAQLWQVPNASHVQAFKVAPVAYLDHLYQLLRRVDPDIHPPPQSLGFST